QAFRRDGGYRVTEQKRREGCGREVGVEIECGAGDIGRATEERGSAKIEAELQVVRAHCPREVIVDLMQVVEIESVAAVLFRQGRKAADSDGWHTSFARRE